MKEEAKLEWNKNNVEERDLTDKEKVGIEKLREKNPAYASFVARTLPMLDSSKTFLSNTMDDAKRKIEENKNILKENQEASKDASPMVYDENIAKLLISEGSVILNGVERDKSSLERAIQTSNETIHQVRIVTAAANIPLVNPNDDKDKNKNKDNEDEKGKPSDRKEKKKKGMFKGKNVDVNDVALDRVRDKIDTRQNINSNEDLEKNKKSNMDDMRGIEYFPIVAENNQKEETTEKPKAAISTNILVNGKEFSNR